MNSSDTANTGKVMVLSAAAGAGHVSAAETLVSVFAVNGTPANHVEVLKYTNPVFRKMYSDMYIEMVNKQPELLGWIYNSLDHPWRFQKRRLALDMLNSGPLISHIKREKPSMAVCTHFLPAEILLHLKKKKQIDIPVGMVVTDMDAHAMWLYKNVDWYFVACEETKAYLSEIGIPPETIHVTGIPIKPAFSEPVSKPEVRVALGLAQDRMTVLISAGGFGVGPVEAIIQALQKVRHSIQTVIICGKNETLRNKLSSMSSTHPLKVVGYTTEMQKWMAASDLMVGKPGGLTSSEALASGLIMVIVNPIPGQEERNSDHFLEEGVAIRCNNLPALAYKIDSLLSDGDRVKRMREAARRLGRPRAAMDIVSILKNSLQTK